MSVNLALTGPLALAIYNWFKDATGLTVIWDDQSGIRPEKPYGTLRVISGPAKVAGHDEQRVRQSDNKIEVSGIRVFTVSCNIYGANALSLMSQADAWLGHLVTLEAFRAAGLAVVRNERIQNLTRLMDTGFESRAQMDVVFSTASVLVDDITGIIETVETTAGPGLDVEPKTQVIGD